MRPGVLRYQITSDDETCALLTTAKQAGRRLQGNVSVEYHNLNSHSHMSEHGDGCPGAKDRVTNSVREHSHGSDSHEATLLNSRSRSLTQVTCSIDSFYEVDLYIEADYHYFLKYGSNRTAVVNQMVSIIEAVNQQYEAQLQTTFKIKEIVVRETSEANPYTTNDIIELWFAFREEVTCNTDNEWDTYQELTY